MDKLSIFSSLEDVNILAVVVLRSTAFLLYAGHYFHCLHLVVIAITDVVYRLFNIIFGFGLFANFNFPP